MLKRICDKCGKEKKNINDTWYSIRIKPFKGIEVLIDHSEQDSYELCPDCYNDFKAQFANNN
jgi:hypothetical protein